MGGASLASGLSLRMRCALLALFLPPRSTPISGTISLDTLYAQTAKTILVDRLLPGVEFIDGQRVAATRLFQRKQSNANRGNNHGFPLRYPTFCFLWRQIGDRRHRTVWPDDMVASWAIRLSHGWRHRRKQSTLASAACVSRFTKFPLSAWVAFV
jgi:hypothetical protein